MITPFVLPAPNYIVLETAEKIAQFRYRANGPNGAISVQQYKNVFTSSTGDFIPPTVQLVSIAGTDVNAPVRVTIRVNDAASGPALGTIIDSAFAVEQGGSALSKTFVISQNDNPVEAVLEFTPTTPGDVTITALGGSIADLAGNAIASDIPLATIPIISGDLIEFETTATGAQSVDIGVTTTGGYVVDWGDGSTSDETNYAAHTYSDAAPSHTVRVIPDDYLAVTEIDASSSRISRFASKGLVNLETLQLHANQLTAFASPPEWVNLQTLRLNANQLTTFVSPPEWEILKVLRLNTNQLTAFTSPPEWVNLETLQLQNNKLTTFTSPPEWVKLRSLQLQTNLLTAFTSPPEWLALNVLRLDANKLTAFTSPPEWVNLGTLQLQANRLTAFTSPPEWVNLQTLRLNSNQLTIFASPPEWVKLIILELQNNQLSSFSSRAEWVRLQTLKLGTNRLTVFSSIAAWVDLSILELGNNLLTAFTSRPEWVDLQTLEIQENQLTALTILTEWTALSMLQLNNNEIADLDPIYTVLSTVPYTATDRAVSSELNPGSASLPVASITAAQTNGWTVTN